MQVVAILLVLRLNRRAWVLALAALTRGLWYLIVVNLVNRPRPVVGEVLRVTEHPGFDKLSERPPHLHHDQCRHLLMLCIRYRYLPR
ncbi:MAG TPA: hypothetical protein VND96_05225 [Candidatus Micrarchaeaceae archaeon]|nr:hypothetical protein [Candidatus Micrarchaeaceae archaeon]